MSQLSGYQIFAFYYIIMSGGGAGIAIQNNQSELIHMSAASLIWTAPHQYYRAAFESQRRDCNEDIYMHLNELNFDAIKCYTPPSQCRWQHEYAQRLDAQSIREV